MVQPGADGLHPCANSVVIVSTSALRDRNDCARGRKTDLSPLAAAAAAVLVPALAALRLEAYHRHAEGEREEVDGHDTDRCVDAEPTSKT